MTSYVRQAQIYIYYVQYVAPCDILYMYIVHKVDRIEVSEAWDRYI